MSVLGEIRARFSHTLSKLAPQAPSLIDMIRPAQDPQFGDYQVNCAMPLEKTLGRPARLIAEQLLTDTSLSDLARGVVAGPGFINLTLNEEWLQQALLRALADPRLSVSRTLAPKTFVIDYSSPNVAKPMHVGHIRSTVIGDALTHILRFVGHRVISDNHLGDWGTQFGMIIYGYRNFLDRDAYARNPIVELGRIYRVVQRIVDYYETKRTLPAAEAQLVQLRAAESRVKSDAAQTPDPNHKDAAKKKAKELAALTQKIKEQESEVRGMQQKIAAMEGDQALSSLAKSHVRIEQAVLEETAKLHADDPDNLKLWHEVLPHCRADIQEIYERLNVRFDEELGESYYHDRLASVVQSLSDQGIATESDGAICVFLDGFDTPMIVRKKDGAYLYSTSDLATIQYRIERWNPNAILYVVDHRQHEHFKKLFAAARRWGIGDVELTHVSFGTVLGDDGTPFKTRAGDTVGLRGLLDEAAERARSVVEKTNPGLDEATKTRIAETVGIGALKYADLSQSRTTDYRFSYDKMLALNGNTATYLQYLYARVQGVMSKGKVDVAKLRGNPQRFDLTQAVERKLAMQLIRFEDAILDVLVDYRPNLLTNYLFELTQTFFEFYEKCPILEASSPELRISRLQLCDLAGRTVRQGLELLGIAVVDQM